MATEIAASTLVTKLDELIAASGGGTPYTEDAAAASDPVGPMSMAVRADSLGAVTTTDGDNIALRSTNKGELYVKQTDAVPITDNSGSVTVDAAELTAIAASASVLDDWDESDRAKVNLIAGQAGIAGGTGVDGATVPRFTLATNVGLPAGSAIIGQVLSAFATITSSVTRPADTTAYAANDAWANSDSAPTAGGYTFTSAARASGKSGIITDLIVVSSNDPATLLYGELWVYDSAVATADNDNAAFTSSDADTLLLVAVIPFVLASTAGGSSTTSYAHVQNLSVGFTAIGTANLRFKVKVKNAYTPASAEVLSFRLKIRQVD